MADKTGIEWTDATWNPVTGCTKVSPGCDHCYAETLAERFRGTAGHYYEHGFDVQLRPDKLDQPLRWRRPRRIFVNSMSDPFHDDVPDEYIARVFAVMALTPHHTFQLLTKRHGRMRSLLNSDVFWARVSFVAGEEFSLVQGRIGLRLRPGLNPRQMYDRIAVGHPLDNVWLGVSVENQQWADIRIPALLDTPAAVRFLSCEPLLGPVDLSPWLTKSGRECAYRYHDTICGAGQGGCFHPPCRCECHRLPDVRLDWVIVGGECGRGARPMHPDWARQLRDQCTAAGVAFHFKQWGDGSLWVDKQGDVWAPGPDGLMQTPETAPFPREYVERKWGPLKRLSRKAAGRELNGRTWDEYPAIAERAS